MILDGSHQGSARMTSSNFFLKVVTWIIKKKIENYTFEKYELYFIVRRDNVKWTYTDLHYKTYVCIENIHYKLA